MTRSKKVWVAGAAGQLGTAIQSIAKGEFPWLEILPTTRADMDYTSPVEIAAFFRENRPDIAVNCIAYTNVDGAEKEYEIAKVANATIPATISSMLAQEHLPLIHVSTDHVFGGDKRQVGTPFTEEGTPSPANAYALSKYLGEYATGLFEVPLYLLRTAWLYGPESWKNKSFYKSIRRKALEEGVHGGTLRVVTDEISTPTSVFTLARVILSIATLYGSEEELPVGVYHVCDKGEASRHAFAEAIVALDPRTAHLKVEECLQEDLSLPARRPQYSKLETKKIEHYFPTLIRPWQEALREIYHYDNPKQ